MSISNLNNDISQIIRESRIKKIQEQHDMTEQAIFVNIFQNVFGITDATILKRDFDSTDLGSDFFAISEERIWEVIDKKKKLLETKKLLEFVQIYQETKNNQDITKKSGLFNENESKLFEEYFGFKFCEEEPWSLEKQIDQLYSDNPGKIAELNNIFHKYTAVKNSFFGYFRSRGFLVKEIDDYLDYMKNLPDWSKDQETDENVFFKLIKSLIEKIDSPEIVENYLLENPEMMKAYAFGSYDLALDPVKDYLIRSN